MVKAKGSLRPLLLLLKLLLLLVLLSCYLEPGWVTASVSGSSPPRRRRSTHRRRRIASPRRATDSTQFISQQHEIQKQTTIVNWSLEEDQNPLLTVPILGYQNNLKLFKNLVLAVVPVGAADDADAVVVVAERKIPINGFQLPSWVAWCAMTNVPMIMHAIRGAIILAKLSVVPVRRGYWGNKIGKPHTVPCKVFGKCGSVLVRPAWPCLPLTSPLLADSPDFCDARSCCSTRPFDFVAAKNSGSIPPFRGYLYEARGIAEFLLAGSFHLDGSWMAMASLGPVVK
ncbi:40S ribosomal protein S2 [Culex quinquefasciatus]|uniref:40S ribosomal protein S2 n=1 Tax=Culex quinquefasciatus TaxID=7176 RepID=B0X2M7_CULQU|nr:40S ribosomal protein S2 [Culex quinquefasciatus]|eukprot:XP_001863899.1 40S ribosomal protein S2 [Culex quinquefasciatus]